VPAIPRKFNWQAFYRSLGGKLPPGVRTDRIGNVLSGQQQAKKIARRDFGMSGRQYRKFERLLRFADCPEKLKMSLRRRLPNAKRRAMAIVDAANGLPPGDSAIHNRAAW